MSTDPHAHPYNAPIYVYMTWVIFTVLLCTIRIIQNKPVYLHYERRIDIAGYWSIVPWELSCGRVGDILFTHGRLHYFCNTSMLGYWA